MRTIVERVDMARLAIMYLHGGVYADLDMELRSAALLRCAVRLNRIILPYEVGRLIGQSILISPPNQLFWKQLAHRLVQDYNSSCYEPQNTGPDAITRVWNERCGGAAPRAGRPPLDVRGVLIVDGLTMGPLTFHHITGSWRREASLARRRGELGCAFRRERLLTTPSASSEARGACGAVLNLTLDRARRWHCHGMR